MRIDEDELLRALSRGGLQAGLQWLNEGVDYRYTAAYTFNGAAFENIGFFDARGDAISESLRFIPLGNSFCQFVRSDGEFRSDDTSADPRLNGHPFQGVVLSYVGAPLLDRRGRFFGALSHFDLGRQSLSDAQLATLRRAARLLPGYLP